MNRRLAIGFALCQGLGAIGFLLWESVESPVLLVGEWVLLLPGNLVAPRIVSAALWRGGLSLRAVSVWALVLTIALNALVWVAVVSIYRRYRSQHGRAA
jgi:hypothetical protein